MSLSDRRRHARYSIPLRAVVLQNGRYMNGTLVEVSASGGLVVCEEGTMQLGDACALIVFNGNRPAFEVEGTVVNVHYPLAGIRFSADEQLVAETLRRIVDLNFATQQISRREVAALLC